MKCPFCGKEMREGYIPVYRGDLTWLGKNEENESWNEKVVLSEYAMVRVQKPEAFYCPDCRQVIIPIPELESFSDKMKEKLDDVVEKFTAAKDDFMEQREEKRKQREQKKREGKDPWEL